MSRSINLKDFIESISWNKDQSFNKTETQNEIQKFQFIEIVEGDIEDYDTSNVKTNKIYLEVNNANISKNKYNLYIYVDNDWEMIDNLEFDIENYITRTEANNLYALINHGHDVVTPSGSGETDGFMSYEDKDKLDSIEDNANHIIVDSGLDSESTNPVENQIITTALNGKASSTHQHGNLQNNGSIGNSSGKIITTGTNGVLTASSSITKNLISDFTHSHTSEEITDSNSNNYAHIGNLSANATQSTINSALNQKIGSIASTDYQNIVNTLLESNDFINSLHTQLNLMDNTNYLHITDDLQIYLYSDNYYKSYTNPNDRLDDLLECTATNGQGFPDLTITNNGLLINSVSGEKKFYFPVVNPTSMQFTYVSGELRGWFISTIDSRDSKIYGDCNGATTWKIVNFVENTDSQVTSPAQVEGDVIKIVFENNLIKYYKNNTLLTSLSFTQTDNELFWGFYTNTNRNLVIKDVIIK